jgi:hypothetical protein
MTKRVVFLHPDGIPQILGEWSPDLPITAENFTLRGRLIEFASLVKVTQRAVFFREPMLPASYSFDAAQR